jgi:hypothetical protein
VSAIQKSQGRRDVQCPLPSCGGHVAIDRIDFHLELYFPNDVDKREDLKSQMLAQVSKPKGIRVQRIAAKYKEHERITGGVGRHPFSYLINSEGEEEYLRVSKMKSWMRK